MKLFFIIIIVWGIRLYSGLFIFIFLLYYVYKPLKTSKLKPIIVPLFLILIVGVFASSTMLIQQSLDEILLYQEYSIERGQMSGGLSNYLLNLPPVIQQIVLTLYSQFHPFPPFAPFMSASTFSQYYMSILVFVYSIWWAFIFYPLLIFLFIKRMFKNLSSELKILFIIAIVFIIANTAHIDIRRMMPVYPILYLIYLIIINSSVSIFNLKKMNIYFFSFILLLLTTYLFIIA